MVGGKKGEGQRAFYKGVPASSMKRSYNGRGKIGNYYQPGNRIITTDGGLQSPATRLDHEMDHAVDYLYNAHEHNINNDPGFPIGTGPGYDPQFDTKEERRVITGSEVKTALSNRESIRHNHGGIPYRTAGPTTTKPYK